jgi:hypothetical protein
MKPGIPRRLAESGDLVIPASWAQAPEPSGIPPHQPTAGELLERRELARSAPPPRRSFLVPLTPNAPPIPDFGDFIEGGEVEAPADEQGKPVGWVNVDGAEVPPPKKGIVQRTLDQVLGQGPLARKIHAARLGQQAAETFRTDFKERVAAEAAVPYASQTPGDMLNAIAAQQQREREREQELRSLAKATSEDVTTAESAQSAASATLDAARQRLTEAQVWVTRAKATQVQVQAHHDGLLQRKAGTEVAYKAQVVHAAELGNLPPPPSIALTELDSQIAASQIAVNAMPQIVADHQAAVCDRQIEVTTTEGAFKVAQAQTARVRFLAAATPFAREAAKLAELLGAAEGAGKAASMSGPEGGAAWRQIKRLRLQVVDALRALLPGDWRELKGIL